MAKTCVCFYGLPQRSLKYTLDNIQKNVLFDSPDVFLHTFDTKVAQCIRGQEPPTPVDPQEILKLSPTSYKIDSEEEFNKVFNFKLYEDFGNPFPGDPGGQQTMHNLLRELYSIQQVWKMIPHPEQYDRITMTRADLLFDRPLDWIPQPGEILTAQRPPGILNHNDFFAIGRADSLRPWADRLTYAVPFCEWLNGRRSLWGHQGLHPETLITYIIGRFNLNSVEVDVGARRVRATGKILN